MNSRTAWYYDTGYEYGWRLLQRITNLASAIASLADSRLVTVGNQLFLAHNGHAINLSDTRRVRKLLREEGMLISGMNVSKGMLECIRDEMEALEFNIVDLIAWLEARGRNDQVDLITKNGRDEAAFQNAISHVLEEIRDDLVSSTPDTIQV